MQQAFVVLAGNRIFGLGQVEGYGSVFEDDGAGGLAEKILQGAG